jgi:hypothetical protein
MEALVATPRDIAFFVGPSEDSTPTPVIISAILAGPAARESDEDEEDGLPP